MMLLFISIILLEVSLFFYGLIFAKILRIYLLNTEHTTFLNYLEYTKWPRDYHPACHFLIFSHR